MAVKRRGGAYALAWVLLLGGGAGVGVGACASKTGTGAGGQRMDTDAAIYQECTSVCVRPGDCAKAYNDDGICPPGFYCALRFNCSTD